MDMVKYAKLIFLGEKDSEIKKIDKSGGRSYFTSAKVPAGEEELYEALLKHDMPSNMAEGGTCDVKNLFS
jgi:hypothetical protein